jgi:Domain of unknown function (DUF4375)
MSTDSQPENEPTLLDLGIDHAFAECERLNHDLYQLPSPLQTVVLVSYAQDLIDDAGFRAFFESDMPGTPPYAIFSNAYRSIGATTAADLLDVAIGLFPFPNPHLDSAQRNAYMNSLNDDSDELFILGDELSDDASIWDQLELYIEANAVFFNLTIN